MNTHIEVPPRKRRQYSAARLRREQVLALAIDDPPQTARQIFYRLVSLPDSPYPKIDKTYTTVSRDLADMRLYGELPYEHIIDSSRNPIWDASALTREPGSGNFDDFIEEAKSDFFDSAWFYKLPREPLMDSLVQVWCETRGIAGLLEPMARRYGVSLIAFAGRPSVTLKNDAAKQIADKNSTCSYLLYIGDYDDHGMGIGSEADEWIRLRLSQLDHDGEISFERLAVNKEQIDLWNLPTKPAEKASTITRTVEAESIPKKLLLDVVETRLKELVTRDDDTAHSKAQHEAQQELTEMLANYWFEGGAE